MATLRVTLQDQQVQQRLGQLRQRMSNLKPLMADIGEYLVRETDNRFKTETGPDGQAWAPLAAATLARKQKKGKIPKILQQEGSLRTTIVYQASQDQVEVGSNRIYSTIHQFGGQAGRSRSVTIPARPYLGINAEDEQEIAAIIDDYLQG